MSSRNTRSKTNPALCDERDANKYVSRIIPWVLLGIIAYASYAVTKPLCIDYLIHPQSHYPRTPRIGTGVAIIVVYYVLLFPVIVTYLRLYYVVFFSPDFLPRGAEWTPELEDAAKTSKDHSRQSRSSEAGHGNREKRRHSAAQAADIERQTGGVAFPLDDSSHEIFWMKDIFVCQDDGRPPYCSRCCQFKTDRSHHNRDVDRCVRKLDHFCPWVGGVVSESSHKFFLQFIFYTAVFTCFTLIALAIFIAELRSDTGSVNAHWAVALGLAGLFFLFSGGMCGTSLQLAAINATTIENISRQSKVWTLAIYIPPHKLQQLSTSNKDNQWAQTFSTITYPLQPADPAPTSPADIPSSLPNGSSTKPATNAHPNTRTFAIVRTEPGENPFDLGDPIKNLQQAMGYTLWEWLLPLKVAPCVDHSSPVSAYPMGPVVERLKREASLISSGTDKPGRRRTHRKRRHRRWHKETGERGGASSLSDARSSKEEEESQQSPETPL